VETLETTVHHGVPTVRLRHQRTRPQQHLIAPLRADHSQRVPHDHLIVAVTAMVAVVALQVAIGRKDGVHHARAAR